MEEYLACKYEEYERAKAGNKQLLMEVILAGIDKVRAYYASQTPKNSQLTLF